ncbi:SDR family NAD(P)-dependent oxidoreductase [Nannocystaceae bacterium ST9]
MHVVFLGATKGMGRALARQMAERGDNLVLLGRDLAELERSAADLRARGPKATVEVVRCDLADPSTFAPALDQAEETLGKLDCVVVSAGVFATQDALEANPEHALEVVTLDFANTVGFCEHARVRLMKHAGGTLCVFSSVAGDRARKPVVIYGAAKAGLSAYLEGLDHRYRSQGLVTVCVKPGFVKTGMTAGLKPPPFAGEPESVARRVLKAIDRGTPVVYAPWPWRFVMMVIRSLPRFVMRRIGF